MLNTFIPNTITNMDNKSKLHQELTEMTLTEDRKKVLHRVEHINETLSTIMCRIKCLHDNLKAELDVAVQAYESNNSREFEKAIECLDKYAEQTDKDPAIKALLAIKVTKAEIDAAKYIHL
jgi:Trp operon repressor